MKASEALEDAEERLRAFEQVVRDAKEEYYHVATELEMAESAISKHDEYAAASKSEYATLLRTNEQLSSQLSATVKNSLAKEEYASMCKAEVEKADKALLLAIGNTAQLKSELQQAELATEDTDDHWNAWYADLQHGIDESESATELWKHLCDKV